MLSGLLDTALLAASSTVMVLGVVAITAGLVLGIRALVRRIRSRRLHWPTNIKAWNARQWLWVCVACLTILFTFVMSSLVHHNTEYCYWYEDAADIPPGKYVAYIVPTDEYLEQYDRAGGYAVETVSDPSNPWWVRFYHEGNHALPGIVLLIACIYMFDKTSEGKDDSTVEPVG